MEKEVGGGRGGNPGRGEGGEFTRELRVVWRCVELILRGGRGGGGVREEKRREERERERRARKKRRARRRERHV